MIFNKKHITSSIIFLLLLELNFPIMAISKQLKDEEEKQFTPLEKINKTQDTAPTKDYDEGVTIKTVEFQGNNLLKNDELKSLLNIKEGSKFDRDGIQQDLKKLYNTGYFTEHMKAIPEITDKGVTLKITVEENVPVTGFTVLGNKVLGTDEILKILNKQAGLPQNLNELNKAIQDIEKAYADKGFILARVKSISDDPDGVINIDVNEGYINSIKVVGNTRTKDFVIKRNIALTAGQVYNENLVKADLSSIFSTQAFSDVRRSIAVSPENPENYDITIEVDEKRTGSISLGGGLDTQTGLFGSVGYLDKNFRGNGQELSVTAMSGSGFVLRDIDTIRRPNFDLQVNFLEPRFRQTLTSIETRAFGKDLVSYQVPLALERRFGAAVELARPIKKVPHLAGSVSFGMENINMREGNEQAIRDKYNAIGLGSSFITDRANQLIGGTFISLSPSLVYDTRDNCLNPTRGFYASTTFSENFKIAGDADSFGKVSGSVRKFYPVGKKSTFTIGGKVGMKAIGELPEFASYRLGGATTIRGFREGDVGNGNGFMMASAELRTPIPFMDRFTENNFLNNLRTAYFIDAGTLMGGTITNQLYNRGGGAISTGMGLRINVPGLGPIKVDYGIPITALKGGAERKGRFTFGFGEFY